MLIVIRLELLILYQAPLVRYTMIDYDLTQYYLKEGKVY